MGRTAVRPCVMRLYEPIQVKQPLFQFAGASFGQQAGFKLVYVCLGA